MLERSLDIAAGSSCRPTRSCGRLGERRWRAGLVDRTVELERRIESLAQEMDERLRAQEALTREEAKFRIFIEKLPAISYIAKPGKRRPLALRQSADRAAARLSARRVARRPGPLVTRGCTRTTRMRVWSRSCAASASATSSRSSTVCWPARAAPSGCATTRSCSRRMKANRTGFRGSCSTSPSAGCSQEQLLQAQKVERSAGSPAASRTTSTTC